MISRGDKKIVYTYSVEIKTRDWKKIQTPQTIINMNKHRNHDEQYISPPNQAVNLTIPEL